MHELSLAESILDLVREHVPPARAAVVGDVHVAVGDDAGVLADSLEFCFSAVATGTPYAGATLVIDRVPGHDLRVVAIDLRDLEEVTP